MRALPIVFACTLISCHRDPTSVRADPEARRSLPASASASALTVAASGSAAPSVVASASDAVAPSASSRADRAAKLAAELDKLEIVALGSLPSSSTKPAEALLADKIGAAPSGIAGSGGGGVVAGGGKGGGGGIAPVDPGPSVKTPTGDVEVGPVGASTVPDANAVVARNRWRFKSCYSKTLQVDPEAAGTAIVAAKIGVEGDVTSAKTSGPIPPSLGKCIDAAFQSMRFSPPGDGMPAPLVVKMVFAKKP